MKFTREFYIPTGSVKVADKHSSAVVYLFKNMHGQICANGFHGKAAKPEFKHAFRDEAQRETYVRKFFKAWQDAEARKKARREEAKKPHTLELGHILVASWGYEQTNVNYYQITKLIGSHMVEVREIAQVSEETAWAQGRCTPKLDAFIGDPLRRKVSSYGTVKVSACQFASVWDGTPRHWTAYH